MTVDTLFVDLSLGDRLLLCTGRVYTQFTKESELGELLREGTPEHAARRIVDRALESGSDNATALLVQICARLVKRATHDRGLLAADLDRARQSTLLAALTLQQVLNALSAAVEVELESGARVPRAVASDLVAYIVLDGVVRLRARQGGPEHLFPERCASRRRSATAWRSRRALAPARGDFKKSAWAIRCWPRSLYRHLPSTWPAPEFKR